MVVSPSIVAVVIVSPTVVPIVIVPTVVVDPAITIAAISISATISVAAVTAAVAISAADDDSLTRNPIRAILGVDRADCEESDDRQRDVHIGNVASSPVIAVATAFPVTSVDVALKLIDGSSGKAEGKQAEGRFVVA